IEVGELWSATGFDFPPPVKRHISVRRDLGPNAAITDDGVSLGVQTGKTETRIGPGHTATVDHDPQAAKLTVVDTGPGALTEDQRRSVQLDNVYSQVIPGTWAVITRAGVAGSPFVGQ